MQIIAAKSCKCQIFFVPLYPEKSAFWLFGEKRHFFVHFLLKYLQISLFFRNFAADYKITIMASPVIKRYNTPEEKAAVFEKWIHLREEWEAHVRQREIELGIV